MYSGTWNAPFPLPSPPPPAPPPKKYLGMLVFEDQGKTLTHKCRVLRNFKRPLPPPHHHHHLCLTNRKWCGLIGFLQKTNQVAVGSIPVFEKLGCVFIKGKFSKIGVLPCFFVQYKNISLECLWCIIVPRNGEELCCIFSFEFKARLAFAIQFCTEQTDLRHENL